MGPKRMTGARRAPLRCPGGRCYDTDSSSESITCSDSECSDCNDFYEEPKKKKACKKKTKKAKGKGKAKGKKLVPRGKAAEDSDSTDCDCKDCQRGYSSDDSYGCPPKRGGRRNCPAY